jgi:hypothetical protein
LLDHPSIMQRPISSEFGKQLKKVIFSHVPNVERNNCDSLDELIKVRTSEILLSLDSLRSELREINRDLVEYERQVSDEYRHNLSQKLKIKKQELEAHRQNVIPEKVKPGTNSTLQAEIENLKDKVGSLVICKQDLTTELKNQNDLKVQIEKAFEKLDNFEREYEKFQNSWNQEFALLDLKANQIAVLTVNKVDLEEKRNYCIERITKIKEEISSIDIQTISIEEQVKIKSEQFDEPEKTYQRYLTEIDQWKKKEEEIIGSVTKNDSIKYYEDLLDKSNNTVPQQLIGEKIKRLNKSKEIFLYIQKIANVYKALYKPVQEFVDSNESIKNDYKLLFEVSIVANKFDKKFFEYISQSVRGTFKGTEEGRNKLSEFLELSDFNQESKIEIFLNKVIEMIEFEDNQSDKPVKVEKQLKTSKTSEDFYNFLFSLEYLEPRYTLKLGSNAIKQLSPGERGALLLVFYLLIDNSDIPIIIDQPEHNLDSESIYKLLHPCVRKAKKRRQIFMITHNPNLAVVCDAEQVIYSEIKKTKGNLVSYMSGAIENPDMRKKVIDVLEGTLPAFNNRESKYQINS